ncbi:Listeria/Bacterioides repeat-containing protein [Treponema bryantii]|uniref:Listeria/Bacterioides repeat-containing protein n=1 Tax=Treponema bryantii TaxID=163 RepID=A0A1H9HYF8_9SPIR|nr:InlB B-repeat-containing protein [Treponema bryantii]SEQ67381.1 Listeria/Bacterioides repeat-containing protein [Treponema bryantii]
MIKKLFKCFVYTFILLFLVSCQNQLDMKEVYTAMGGKKDGITFTITYKNVGDLENPNPTSFTISQDVTLQEVQKNGFAFGGWYTDPSCDISTRITGWKAYEKTNNVVLYAKFVQEKYNITYYNVNGLSNPNPRTYNVKNDVTLLPVEKPGYLFLGWYTDSSCSPQSKIEGWAAYEKQQDMYLYANFKQVGIYMDHRVIIFKGTTDSPVTLIPTVVGYDNSNPVWTSLDTDVAIVQDGVVSPVNYGITTVKYETDGGAAYVFIIVMQDYANTTYDSGTVPVENGYYTNSANVVSYSFKNGRLDFRGRLTNSSNWCQTTCGNGGWTWNVNGTSVNFQDGNNTVSVGDIDLTVIPVLAYDSATNTSFVVIYQMLTNTSNTKITGAKMASHSDTMLASNDRANIMPKAYGARMYDPNTKLAFDMYCCDGDDCTPVDTLWYGYYYQRTNHLWDGTIYKEHVTNTDTGMCYGWMNIDIEPGETVLRSIRMTLVEYDPNNP